VDTTAPNTVIDTAPPASTNSADATFTFHATDSGVGGGFLSCQVDTGALKTCTSPLTASGLTSGSHTFQVQATDAAGNADASPATYTWVVDTTAPTVTIDRDKLQADPVTTGPVHFTAVFNEKVVGFGDAPTDVSLSGSANPTTATVTEMAPNDGTTYDVAVSGMNANGTVIATIPASAAADPATNASAASTSTDNTVDFILDNTPPDTTIGAKPSDPSHDPSATFSFSGTDNLTAPAKLTFECKLDGAAFAACTGPANLSGLADGGHTFQVRATDALGNVDPTPASYTWTIDTVSPTISISAPAATPEGNTGTKTLDFSVTLSKAPWQPVTVKYATADGTATVANNDYVAAANTLTWNPGDPVTRTVSVTVNGDTLAEPDETFTVNLTSPTNATIATAQATATIQNDDGTPGLSINDVSVTEGNSGTTNATFTVTLSAVSGQTLTVVAQTANATAMAGSDYTAAGPMTLTFDPGTTTRTLTVPVLGDTVVEPDETFTVKLSNPTNATIVKAEGTAMIVNDDAAAPAHCAPRPPVQVTTSPTTSSSASGGTGALLVTITATTNAGTPTNEIQRIEWGQMANATVTLPGSGGGTIVHPNAQVTAQSGTQSVTAVVMRTEGGKSLTVPFTVYDTCGAWPSFVGGGAGAF
jgi:hypothetical protein